MENQRLKKCKLCRKQFNTNIHTLNRNINRCECDRKTIDNSNSFSNSFNLIDHLYPETIDDPFSDINDSIEDNQFNQNGGDIINNNIIGITKYKLMYITSKNNYNLLKLLFD